MRLKNVFAQTWIILSFEYHLACRNSYNKLQLSVIGWSICKSKMIIVTVKRKFHTHQSRDKCPNRPKQIFSFIILMQVRSEFLVFFVGKTTAPSHRKCICHTDAIMPRVKIVSCSYILVTIGRVHPSSKDIPRWWWGLILMRRTTPRC